MTINVTNIAPMVMFDEFTTLHDQALSIDAWIGVLANDSDADGDSLSAIIVQGSPYVTLASDGSFVCTPPPAWGGEITFTYSAFDGVAQSSPATVTIHVTNDAPVAPAYEFTLHAGLVLSLDATSGLMHDAYDVNYDALTAEQVGAGPTHGTLSLNADRSFTYEATEGFVGDDSFSYRLSDCVTPSSPAMVTIHVQNERPVGTADEFDVWNSVSPGVYNVLDNDSDSEADTLTTQLDTYPSTSPQPAEKIWLHAAASSGQV